VSLYHGQIPAPAELTAATQSASHRLEQHDCFVEQTLLVQSSQASRSKGTPSTLSWVQSQRRPHCWYDWLQVAVQLLLQQLASALQTC